jgi:hypothetical protein
MATGSFLSALAATSSMKWHPGESGAAERAMTVDDVVGMREMRRRRDARKLDDQSAAD